MTRKTILAGLAGAAFAALATQGAAAQSNPIRIGCGMALTGGLAANGKAALMAMELWRDDVNAKGGLLGRKVELTCYDDQSNPSTVPGIYTKLLDVDKVDLVVSGYGTNLIAPAMPIIMQRGKTFMGLFGLAANDEFNYSRYFGLFPAGPKPKTDWSIGFFELAGKMQPKPQTIAIAYADAEFANNAAVGAREHAKRLGLKVVYDRSYPPPTVDFTPIVRSIQAVNPDVVYIAAYPPDSAGMVRAINEVGLKTKLCCGGMVGLQYAALKTQLGPMLNTIVNYDTWVPEPTLKFAGIDEFLKRYQAKAPEAGVDPLGFYLPPFAYAQMQVLEQAITATKGLDQNKLADYMHGNKFKTVVGEIDFEKNGEWTAPRMFMVQFQGVQGNGLDQFKKAGTQVVLYPPDFKSGDIKPFK